VVGNAVAWARVGRVGQAGLIKGCCRGPGGGICRWAGFIKMNIYGILGEILLLFAKRALHLEECGK
jgi:hypothetical protein